MNLTFGDLILVEIALLHYLKDIDLALQSGQYMSQLLGKIEFELGQLNQAAGSQLPGVGLQPPAVLPNT